MIKFEEGAVIVDLSLGSILVFSSLAAIIAPVVYRILLTDYANDRTRECVIGDVFSQIMDCSIGSDIAQFLKLFTKYSAISAGCGKYGNSRFDVIVEFDAILFSTTKKFIASIHTFGLRPCCVNFHRIDGRGWRYLDSRIVKSSTP